MFIFGFNVVKSTRKKKKYFKITKNKRKLIILKPTYELSLEKGRRFCYNVLASILHPVIVLCKQTFHKSSAN